MIYAQQFFPESFTENLNIPESNDAMPDVLSECLYELRWLLKMQICFFILWLVKNGVL